jgi:alkylation response protein AidB-like acyl-CoA dehydrogenase
VPSDCYRAPTVNTLIGQRSPYSDANSNKESTATRTSGPSEADELTLPTALTFENVLAHVAERRHEFTADRHVPRDMVEEFRQVGTYRATTPKRFGPLTAPEGAGPGPGVAPALYQQRSSAKRWVRP